MYTRSGTLKPTIKIEDYLPLVKKIAHHMMARLPANVQVDDLIQSGMLGLLDAVEKFEDGQGAQFETYATQRVRGAILDDLRKDDWLPRSVRQAQRQIDTTLNKLEQTLGRPPLEKEMAQALNISLADYQSMLLDARGSSLFSIDDIDYDDDSSNSNYLEFHEVSDLNDPYTELADSGFKAALVEHIESLPEREKLVMNLYYVDELNFKEIAAVLEVTESRVSQIHTQAIARLRSKLKDW